MQITWYPWLNPLYRQLTTQWQQGREHHAILLHHPPGVGAASLIYALTRWLLCQRRQGLKSCGECHACQLMKAGTHPDWLIIRPEKEKSQIGIDAIRRLTETLGRHSWQAGQRVIEITPADALTEEAANALLKTLEEPPARCCFILSCHEPSRLLTTLRSRCVAYFLPPPEEAVALRWLAQQGCGDACAQQVALRLNGGAPLRALESLRSADWADRIARLTCFVKAGQELTHSVTLLAQLNHDQAPQRIEEVISLLLDALKWQQGERDRLVNRDCLHLIEQLAAQTTALSVHQCLRGWLKCRDQLRHVAGVNRELLLMDQILEQHRCLTGTAAVLPLLSE